MTTIPKVPNPEASLRSSRSSRRLIFRRSQTFVSNSSRTFSAWRESRRESQAELKRAGDTNPWTYTLWLFNVFHSDSSIDHLYIYINEVTFHSKLLNHQRVPVALTMTWLERQGWSAPGTIDTTVSDYDEPCKPQACWVICSNVVKTIINYPPSHHHFYRWYK